jgi:aerobic carbon-monoxide dehydrogenase large subunit
MREFRLGAAVPRSEDPRLLRGQGRYTDDLSLPDVAYLYVLRSPHAAAKLRKVDAATARTKPGVLAIFTGTDAICDGLGTFASFVPRTRPDGSTFVPPYRVLAVDRVRHIGDPVAAVIAETVEHAKNAAELVEVDYEILPAIVDTASAALPGQPSVWDEAPENICFVFRLGDKTAAGAAFANAKHIVQETFHISRVIANPIEPRAAMGCYDASQDRYTLFAGVQAPHIIRDELARSVFKMPASRLRVVSPDVGGAFGLKAGAFPELALVLWAAKQIGRPVKWVCERSEAFIADHHARDNVSRVRLALDEHGKFLALGVETIANIGAYIDSFGLHCPTNNLGGLTGPYDIANFDIEVKGVFTNTHATCAYRGAGRPEASYCTERIIEIAAREIGISALELRRRNMIPPQAMPFDTRLVYTYDSGAFEQTMDQALGLADWDGISTRRKASADAGLLHGVGLAYAVEIAGGPHDVPLPEMAEIRFDACGDTQVLVGTHSHGQGHETAFRQVIRHFLGLDPERVRIVYGDTDQIYFGTGTFGSRSLSVASEALQRASEEIIDKGTRIAGHLLEAATADIEFADGRFTVAGTDRTVDLATVAQTSFNHRTLPSGVEPGLSARAVISPAGATYPNGCHVCEVEIDPETGAAWISRYVVVDDVGRVINPLLLKGQLHGGIAQGAGQAFWENIAYDRDSGQLLSGSFMDYCMPRAADVPAFMVASNEIATTANPLGVKGAGEAGTVGALPAVMNAINDALAPLGIRHFEMPATPERLWRAIRDVRSRLAVKTREMLG